MSKYVDGNYTSMEDVTHAINALVMRGYNKDGIVVVTNENKKQEIPSDLDMNVTTDDSYPELNDYKNDIQNGHFIVLADEDSSINEDQRTGSTNGEAESPAVDPARAPDLGSTASRESYIGNDTSREVPATDKEDEPGDIPVDEDHDLKGPHNL